MNQLHVPSYLLLAKAGLQLLTLALRAKLECPSWLRKSYLQNFQARQMQSIKGQIACMLNPIIRRLSARTHAPTHTTKELLNS